MNKRLPVLLILMCLLCGCSAGAGAEFLTAPADQSTESQTSGYYDPDSTLEAQTNGALRCYPLNSTEPVMLRLLPEGRLLLMEPENGATILTILSGPDCTPLDDCRLPFALQESSVQPCGNGLSCFDPVSGDTIVLDQKLQEVHRIPAPAGLLGASLLSEDGSRLYYATEDSLRVFETATGISSVLKRSVTPQIPFSLTLQGKALVCRESDSAGTYSLICTQTGATLYSAPAGGSICGSESVFYARGDQSLVFGTPGETLWELLSAEPADEIFPIPGCHCAVSVSDAGESGIALSRYDLSTGQRTGTLTLPPGEMPQNFLASKDGRIWFWRFDRQYRRNTLYQWDPSASPSGDDGVYTSVYYAREAPDTEGAARCQSYARELEQRYGIRIRIFQEADDVRPEGYRLEYEYRAERTMLSLELLERSLQQYPPGFISTVTGPFEGVTVCLVSDIRGSAQWGTLDALPGIQFWDGTHAYIALAVGGSLPGAFYHQLCHLIDTVVYTHSSAYDTWQSLNPTGFQYDYSYIANTSRNSSAYLLEDQRSFVDMFSMSFPKEDRARIMEYAMLPGNADLFRPPVMQAKLKKLCLGIREAFDLQKAPEVFLWEQYLDTPLGPTT